ncbi:hypothetical protein C8R43DRAFT_956677 [Mycena crocata]|nr:hypothetical protein C8R43DRAFT_956677 [Mycena crocata]
MSVARDAPVGIPALLILMLVLIARRRRSTILGTQRRRLLSPATALGFQLPLNPLDLLLAAAHFHTLRDEATERPTRYDTDAIGEHLSLHSMSVELHYLAPSHLPICGTRNPFGNFPFTATGQAIQTI